ncbi:hypothetical protein KDAU_65720 [Dictyobacter aurantiacus]|uniref:Uncharacterized protein n=1 Tax=Dictyobacter aurantiacus TaxID=1936993 RepID=A0A401ZQU2_9CHLR|nr:hypothetical protein KDAU_65720 [Dictyobacter aurantiacus]
MEREDEVDEFLINYIYKRILSVDILEHEVEAYLQDFSLLKPAWYFDPPIPFF